MRHDLRIHQRILYQQHIHPCGGRRVGVRSKDILEHHDGVVHAPYDARGKERAEQHHSVNELDLAARELELVAEPVDIEEGAAELKEDKHRRVPVHERALVGLAVTPKTSGEVAYESETEDRKRGHGVRDEPKPHDIDMKHADEQIPDEVARRISHHGAAAGIIREHTIKRCICDCALGVEEHSPQRDGADEDALDEGDDVDIPVYPRARVERVVELRDEQAGECGGDDEVDELVGDEREEYVVDVEGESGEADTVGEGNGEVVEPWRAGTSEEVHGEVVVGEL